MADELNEELQPEVTVAPEEEAVAQVFSTDDLPKAQRSHRDLAELYTDEEPLEHHERKYHDFSGSKLSWLVDDFTGTTTSVYEAVMVAAHRARQVGRRQKAEIDAWNKQQEPTPELMQAEETAEKGIDRFQHIKPTVIALGELKEESIKYYYLDQAKK